MTTATCLLRVQTPSSLNPQRKLPSGQKKPAMYPHSRSSSPPSSTANPAPQPASPVPPSPVKLAEGSLAELSSHRSSSTRISAGVGIVSGVCVKDRFAWKCERNDATSAAVKPDTSKRSNP